MQVIMLWLRSGLLSSSFRIDLLILKDSKQVILEQHFETE